MSSSRSSPSVARRAFANGLRSAHAAVHARLRTVPSVGARAVAGARTAAVAALVATVASIGPADAFDELNAAQSLVYDRPHLADTAVGDELVYRYRATLDGASPVTDRATLVVEGAPEDERRDVTLDFLSDERRLELPTFTGYRGNPVLIATLEHFAQSISARAGGGALYVRNRLRDAMASDTAVIEDGTAMRNGAEIDTVSLALLPFADDPFLGARYGDASVHIVFSDAVPGGVLSIGARSGASGEGEGEGEGDAGAAAFDYELRLADDGDG